MGRPRKTHHSNNAESSTPSISRQESSTSNLSTPSVTNSHLPDLSTGEQISPEFWATFTRTYMPPPGAPITDKPPTLPETIPQSTDVVAESQHQLSMPHGPGLYDENFWSDYSTNYVPTPANVPIDVSHLGTMYPPSGNITIDGLIPSCACLPNIYLTLSTLSSLQSFPVDHQTLETLQTAAHTAYSAVYCRVCLTSFQAGLQNLMLVTTLLTTLADSWNRILHTTAYELWQGFYGSIDIASEDGLPKRPWDEREEPYWRLWARQLVYKNVFGTKQAYFPITPQSFPSSPPLSDSENPSNDNSNQYDKIPLTVSTICDALERRQKMFHNEIPQTDEFSRPQCDPSMQAIAAYLNAQTEANKQHHQQAQKNRSGSSPVDHDPRPEHICLSLVQQIRMIMEGMAMTMGIQQRQQ
ncbi:putative c6 finger domain-containing protein [Phaeomoniella chlamydospora]|uniref:Putative c6 finger domain-containing protein n=1 Tax=Phaeomoniella chlamydospora TaxID=158046 RepID=A0A0G2E626_PHACM|nr:putative c6 finger domain-containing protein [Phaeomoniella chlamydospora]